MNNNQLEGVAAVLTAALAEFLKDKEFHTELITFTLAKSEKKKAGLLQDAQPISQAKLDCHFNEQNQWVCTRPH